MSGKGSNRRRENTALVEANWPFPDRKKDQAWLEAVRAENLARANQGMVATIDAALAEQLWPGRMVGAVHLARAITNTEQPAMDGNYSDARHAKQGA